jgi:hypothetical protein
MSGLKTAKTFVLGSGKRVSRGAHVTPDMLFDILI